MVKVNLKICAVCRCLWKQCTI